ncbi:MAG TPA: 50S ribosomal protein L19 [Phycisphaerae bacterium]|nr:50S ribosomal protein L19 [Phycisphaerae bacterium]HNU43693.1 50S ribosomal protein L19 [Phycisphaerae bacterium]
MSQRVLDLVEEPYLKAETPEFRVGDTVDVMCRIIEGDKERIQAFNGTVIARQGHGLNEKFVVRRLVGKEGVERTFLLHSPHVVDVRVRRRGKVRRAKLYYLRNRVGKARRLRELRGQRKSGEAAEEAAAPVPAASVATAGAAS